MFFDSYARRGQSAEDATPLSYFEDKLGQKVEPGDVIAYATKTYDQTYLRVAEVVSVEERPTSRWTDQRFWIKVKPGNESPRMIHNPHRTVLVTKKAARLNG